MLARPPTKSTQEQSLAFHGSQPLQIDACTYVDLPVLEYARNVCHVHMYMYVCMYMLYVCSARVHVRTYVRYSSTTT